MIIADPISLGVQIGVGLLTVFAAVVTSWTVQSRANDEFRGAINQQVIGLGRDVGRLEASKNTMWEVIRENQSRTQELDGSVRVLESRMDQCPQQCDVALKAKKHHAS